MDIAFHLIIIYNGTMILNHCFGMRIKQYKQEALSLKEFYEPMLYLSTPDHPNTMGVLIVLKESVDGDILRGVVEELRVRFPYFYVKSNRQGE